jgi:nucleotide-binding universal stress UspA family protein
MSLPEPRENSSLMASTSDSARSGDEEAAMTANPSDDGRSFGPGQDGGVPVTGGPFRRVLVGWDASAGAVAALSAAASIAGRSGGHVVALAVLPAAPTTEATDDHDSEEAAVRRWAEERFQHARQAAASCHGVRMSLQIVEDRHAARAVCDYAAKHGFDLLVLGRHGDGVGLRPRLGRVAEAAARAGGLPVLLVGGR